MVTGLIYAAIVVLWAAYLVPLALRRYDEASHDRPVESSSRMRILRKGRTHSADSDADADEAAEQTPQPKSTTEPSEKSEPVPSTQRRAAPTVTAPVVGEQRESTRIAIRRRRRTLGALLFATALVAGSAYALIVPWWSVAIPGGLVLAWLVACRIQVLGEIEAAGAPKAMGDEPDDEPTIVISAQLEDYQPARKNVMLDEPLADDALDEQFHEAVPVATAEGASLWDPVPVTVPTYVDKPRAARTVRTIDFNDQDAWTSGHVEGEQTELPADDSDAEDQRRAVGD